MKQWLPAYKVNEYITVGILLTLVFLFGIISTVAEGDFLLIASTAGAIILALIFIKNIELVHLLYALCLGVSFLPYINLQMFPLAGTYVVALIFVVFFGFVVIRSGIRIEISPQAKWMAALLGMGLISMAVAPDKRAAAIYGGQFFLYICVYIAVVNTLDTKQKIVQSLRYVIFGSVIVGIFCVVQLFLSMQSIGSVVDVFFEGTIGELFIGSKGLERIGDSAAVILNRGSTLAESSDLVLFRVFGTFEGPTIFGWYLLVMGLLAGGLYIVQWGKSSIGLSKSRNAIMFLLLLFFLLLTWTRSAILAFFIAIIFILVYRNKQSLTVFTPKVKRFLAISFIAVLLLLFILYLFEVDILTDLVVNFNIQRLGGSAIARLLTILFALNYIVQNPLIGIGIGNYKYVQPGVGANAEGASFATAHNTYLELGVELGLPGLFIFLCLLYSFIRQAAVLVKAPVESFYHTLGIVFSAIWIGFVIVSFFGGSLIHPRFMTLLWILAGIQTASYYLYLDDKKKEDTVYRLEVAH